MLWEWGRILPYSLPGNFQKCLVTFAFIIYLLFPENDFPQPHCLCSFSSLWLLLESLFFCDIVRSGLHPDSRWSNITQPHQHSDINLITAQCYKCLRKRQLFNKWIHHTCLGIDLFGLRSVLPKKDKCSLKLHLSFFWGLLYLGAALLSFFCSRSQNFNLHWLWLLLFQHYWK